MKEVPFLNMLAASWIQFQNHDWVNHGEVVRTDMIDIPLAEDDPARRRYWQTHMFVGRTQPDPTWTADQEETPLTFINEVTHWWDGSQIYGSDQATQDRLRSHVDGKMRLNPDNTLPLDAKGVEDTGFVRNWWVGLTHAAHALRARAQRHLRPPQAGLSRLGRQPAVQRRPPDQRRGHGQDPQRRVDTRNPAQHGAGSRSQRQLVWAADEPTPCATRTARP